MHKIIGHEQQMEQLKKAALQGRLPNAYLFCGPKGVGKRSTANWFSKALVCEHTKDACVEACGNCAGCKKSANGNHPDQFVLEPDGEWIKIDQVRELQASLQFHPLESRVKLAIIDDADRMTDAASNSLLKTLEEPPAFTHFILISSLPHRLLPTIRSRCQTMVFRPLCDQSVADLLASKNHLPKDEALRLARLAGGSLGAALSMDADLVDETIGKLLALIERGASADIIEASQGMANETMDRTLLALDILATWYRDALRYRATGDASAIIHPQAIKFSEKIQNHAAEKNLEEIAKARASVESNANKQLMFEQLLFTLASKSKGSG